MRSMTESDNERHRAVKSRVFASLLYSEIFKETLNADVTWAVFSGIVVSIFIWFHLESLFMSSLAMLSILFSFPVSYLIYTGFL